MANKKLRRLSPYNNIRRKHMQAIVRKRQQSSHGTGTNRRLDFRVLGTYLEPRKIDEWMKDYEIPGDQLYIPSSPERKISNPLARKRL